jgi:hypothetical protein
VRRDRQWTTSLPIVVANGPTNPVTQERRLIDLVKDCLNLVSLQPLQKMTIHPQERGQGESLRVTAKIVAAALAGEYMALIACQTTLIVYFSSEDDGPVDHPSLIQRKYWRSKGKILGRCVEMWDTFNGILDQGVSRNPDIDEDFMHTEL